MSLIYWVPARVFRADYPAQQLVGAENAAGRQRAALDLSVIDFLTWVTRPGWQQGLIERAARLQALSEIRLQPLLKAPAASFIPALAGAREEGGEGSTARHECQSPSRW